MGYPNALADSGRAQVPIEELVATAIADVVSNAHAEGQSLADVISLVLEDDAELDPLTRQWLSEIVAEAWQDFSPVSYSQEAA
jgi:hypothetical protein